MRPPLDHQLIADGLARAVTDGIVTFWMGVGNHQGWSFVVETVDGGDYVYTPEQASAFLDALAAAEHAVTGGPGLQVVR